MDGSSRSEHLLVVRNVLDKILDDCGLKTFSQESIVAVEGGLPFVEVRLLIT